MALAVQRLERMTSTPTRSTPLLLDADILGHLARRRGECLTILLPPSHPGAPEGHKLVTLHSLFHSLKSQEDLDLRKKMEGALMEHDLNGGGSGLAIFAGSDFVEIYRAPVESPIIHQGQACFILPFLLEANAPQDFLILGISKKLLRLVHYLHGEGTELALSPGIPASLAESRHREDHGDPRRQNASPAGGSQGNLGAVQFGTRTEREDEPIHLHHFFAQVDERLAPMLRNRLLLMMGIEEEIADFRRAAKHCHLFTEEIPHGMRDLPVREITQMAHECALSRRRAEGKEALRKFRERGNRKLALDDSAAVLEAAKAGRVHLLCVPEATEGAEEALWNLAVAETLSHGGEVFTAPATSLAAVLRY